MRWRFPNPQTHQGSPVIHRIGSQRRSQDFDISFFMFLVATATFVQLLVTWQYLAQLAQQRSHLIYRYLYLYVTDTQIHLHIYIYTHTHTCIYVYMYCICVCACVCACVCVCVYVHICIPCIRMYTYVYMCICVYVCMCTCVYVYLCTYMCLCICMSGYWFFMCIPVVHVVHCARGADSVGQTVEIVAHTGVDLPKTAASAVDHKFR